MMSESNKQQAVNKLTEIVANFTAMISTRMPDDVVDKLKQLKDAETSSMGKIIYHTMFDNMQKAIDLNRPACQDTGEIMFFVKVGSRFPLLGELQSKIKQAVLGNITKKCCEHLLTHRRKRMKRNAHGGNIRGNNKILLKYE